MCVLSFRGAWCPYCNAQLRAFQRAVAASLTPGAEVAALSVDDEPATAGLIAKHGLTFPVGHRIHDARAIAGLTGAFVDPGQCFLQSTGFILGGARARSWSSSCTPAAPSAGSSPRTCSAWSATCVEHAAA